MVSGAMKLSHVKVLPRGGAARPGGVSAIADALAEPLRVEILRALSRGPQSIPALATSLDIKEEVVSYHLVTVLEKKNRLVVGGEDGRYSVSSARIAQGGRYVYELAETLESLDSEFSAPEPPRDSHLLLPLRDLRPVGRAGAGSSAAWWLVPDNGDMLLGAQLLQSHDGSSARISIVTAYLCEYERGAVSQQFPVCHIAKLPAELVETLPAERRGENVPLLFAGEIRDGDLYVRSLDTPPLWFEANAPFGANGERSL